MQPQTITSKRERLSRDEIAQRAEAMLQHLVPDHASKYKPAPLQRVLDILESKKWILFDHSEDLGFLPGQRKILGRFSVNPNSISIDPILPAWSPRFQFSLAHEIGHFVLHRNLIGKGRQISRSQLPSDAVEQLRYKEMAEMSDLGWVEWQANEFAMALILPEGFLVQKVVGLQIEQGIIRNLGIIYFDDQPVNQLDASLIVTKMAVELLIPKSMIWKRLRYLGILRDRRKSRTKAAFEEIDALFHSI